MGFMIAAGRASLPIELFFKTLKIGFFIWLVTNFPALHTAFMQSMIQMGILAGGGNVATSLIFDPSAIAFQGLLVTEPLFNWFESLSGFAAVKALPAVMITGLCALLILFCFFVMGIQVFVTLLEFYIVSLLALVFIPWGVLKQTAFMAEKAIGLIVAFSVKLMVLAFIISAVQPTLVALALPVDPSYRQVFGMVLGAMTLAYLTWQVPSVAAGLMMGSPSLTAGSAITAMAGMTIGGVLGAQGVAQAGKAVNSSAYSAIKTGSQMYGAAKAGAIMGASTSSGGGMSKLGSGIAGAAQGVVGGALHKVSEARAHAKSGFSAGVTASIAEGERSGYVGSGGQPLRTQQTAEPNQNVGSQHAPAWAIRAASNANLLSHMMSTSGPTATMAPKL